MAFVQIPVSCGFSQLPTEKQSAVYFLWHKSSVVYVGQSKDVTQRLIQHLQDGTKAFTAFSILPCAPKNLDKTERHYIERMLPKYNRCHIAKFVRKACVTTDGTPRPFGPVDDEQAAEFLGVSLERFQEICRAGLGPRKVRMRRCRGKRHHTERLQQWAHYNQELLQPTH